MECHRPQQVASGEGIIFSEGLAVQGELNMSPEEEEPGEPAPRLNKYILGLLGQRPGEACHVGPTCNL